MAFHVGQLVVCVDDRRSVERGIKPPPGGFIGDLDGLTRGRIYTVRRICFDDYFLLTIVVLDEIVRPQDDGYDSTRFRPLSDTRISVFRKMLEPSPEKEGV